MWHIEINPMSIRVLTSSKMLPQLYCATIHNAIFARKGAQCVIMRMPLAQSVCSKVDHHEPGTVVGGSHVIMPEEEQCHPKYLPLGHEACSTRGEEGKCHCKSQLRNHGHRLEQVGDQKGVIVGTCVVGLRAAGQASSSYRQSKKGGQVFYERGPHGTCYTCAWQAPSASQHVPMCTEVSIGPGRCPILPHCQWPCNVRPRWTRL